MSLIIQIKPSRGSNLSDLGRSLSVDYIKEYVNITKQITNIICAVAFRHIAISGSVSKGYTCRIKIKRRAGSKTRPSLSSETGLVQRTAGIVRKVQLILRLFDGIAVATIKG